jgi:hypothetical protein
MKNKKLIVNMPVEEMELLEEACKLDMRTKTHLTRKSLVGTAKKIIKEHKKDAGNN